MGLIVIIVLVLHVLLAWVYAWDWYRTYERVQEAAIRLAISLFLPLVGVVMWKLIDHFYEKSPSQQMSELYFGKGEVDEDLHLLHDTDIREEADVAPAVDVLEHDDYDERRHLVISTLRHSDTADYMEVLRQALDNDDRETSHYASVVIMDLQQRVRDGISACEQRLAADPEDISAREHLEKELYGAITDGIVDESNLRRYGSRYEEISNMLLAEKRPSVGCFHRRIAIDLKHGDGAHARRTAMRFLRVHPDSEDAVIDMMRVCVSLNDRTALDRLFKRLGDMPVVLTERSLRYIRFLNDRRSS